jgi:glycosyltransferase involved in cell wall biosynthesis
MQQAEIRQKIYADPGPLVSVVVPTLDRLDYLRAALRSVMAQSYGNLDIVVQDNASAIDPADLVATLQDPRIRFFRNPIRVNQTRNVVSACQRARGDYVAVLCDDDVWHPDFVRELVAPLEADSEIALAFCDHGIIDSSGHEDDVVAAQVTKMYGRHRLRPGLHRPFDDIAVVHRSIATLSGAMLRRSSIPWDEIPLDMPYGLDLYLAYIAARTKKPCYYEPRRLAQLRYHAGTISSHAGRADQKLANALNARAYWSQFSHDRAMRRNRRYFELKAGQNAAVVVSVLLRRRQWREALAELRRSWTAGLMRPSMLLAHLVYAIRLGRVRA